MPEPNLRYIPFHFYFDSTKDLFSRRRLVVRYSTYVSGGSEAPGIELDSTTGAGHRWRERGLGGFFYTIKCLRFQFAS